MNEKEQLFIQTARNHLIDFSILTNRNYEPNWHHRIIADKLERVERGEIKRLIVQVPPRHGKAIEISTPIMTPNGYKKIIDIDIGDYVFDEKGNKTKVIGKSQVWKNRNVFKVSTDDGYSVIVDENHEWSVRTCRKRQNTRTIWNTKDIFNRKSDRKLLIDISLPIKNNYKKLPIPPYTLGVWLGDGTSADGSWTAGIEDAKIMTKFIEEDGFIVRKQNKKFGYGILGLKVILKKLNLINNKHIPDIYFLSSEYQRRELLKGLIDTDGYVSRDGQVEFCNKSEKLADGVRMLAISLGIKASKITGISSLNGKSYGKKYRILFYAKDICKLPRKKERERENKKPNRYIKVEKSGKADTICLEVENNSHLFLIGYGNLVTHNSQLTSINFPAWYLGRNSNKEIITASYSGDLATDFGSKTRDLINDSIYQKIFSTRLKQDEQSKAKWATNEKGSYISVGVGGATTGRGANVFIIDDPIKNREEAESEVIRKKVWDWYTSVAYTRLEKDGAIVIIMTRWHLDDLVGRLLEFQELGGDKWELVNFPAIATEEEEQRKEGEALWNDKYDIEALKGIKNAIGVYDWNSLYQQNPIQSESQEFKREWFKYFDDKDTERIDLDVYAMVDLAISEKTKADNTSIQVVGKNKFSPNIYRLENLTGKLDPGQVIDYLFFLKEKYRFNFRKVGIESVGYQKSLMWYLNEEMKKREVYFDVIELKATGEKETRIRGLIPMYKNGIILHRKTDGDYENELLEFPFGKHDDRIDAMAYISQVLENTKITKEVKQFTPTLIKYGR